MSAVWPKSLRDVCDKWSNGSEELPPVGARRRLVLEEHDDIPAEHLERNGKEVEVIAHICNGNLAVCVCYDHWARSEVGEWWVAAFNSAAFEPVEEPFWPKVGGDMTSTACDDQFTVEPMSHCMDCGAPGGRLHHHNCATHERDWPEGRMDTLGQNGPTGDHYATQSAAGPASNQPKDAIDPEHYKVGGIETIDYMRAKSTPEEYRGHLRLTALKYLSRAGHKDEALQEYKKARWYLERLIGELEL